MQKWGYEPVVTTDGETALDALRAPDAPRMAILDWMMPKLDGLEVVRRIRSEEGDDPFPIYFIVLTALDAPQEIVRGFDAGADDYVTKPFHKDELKARIHVGVRLIDLRTKLAERVGELERALGEVRTLQGLLPICSYCKKIRDDQNYWTTVESYIETATEAEFSHGVCPDCYQEHLRPKLDELKRDDPAKPSSLRRSGAEGDPPGSPPSPTRSPGEIRRTE